MKKGTGAGLLALVAVLALSSGAAAQQQRAATLQDRAGMGRAKGDQAAKVVVLEIADFQCPYCARFALDVHTKIDSAYIRTGKVQWVFVNFPLPNHANAWLASEAAMCAGGAGGRFWPMHDRLFEAQAEWAGAADPAALFRKYAQESGVTLAEYDACVAGDRVAGLLLQDLLFATSLRITGTPAFIINNEQTVLGMKSFTEWQQLLDGALVGKNVGPRRQ